MRDFRFNCPHCKQSLEAPGDMLGDTINCPACGGSIQLPKPTPAAPPPILHPSVPIRPQQEGAESHPTPASTPTKKSRVKKVFGCLGIIVGVALVLFIAFVAFSMWYFNPKTEVTRTVNTILKSWRDGTPECVAYYDQYFEKKLISPTDWEIRSCEIVANEYAHLVVFVRSSNKGGIPIQNNWKFSLKYKDDRWRLWGLMEL